MRRMNVLSRYFFIIFTILWKIISNIATYFPHFEIILVKSLGLCLDSGIVIEQVSHLASNCLIGRAVAQSGSALRWGCRGREFKSRRPDQFLYFVVNPRMKKIKIGWLGVGVMGYSMAMHFLNAGFPLSLYSRTRSKAHALEERGAQWKDNPALVAEDSDVIFSMLGYPDDVESVLLGENGVVDGIAPGAIMIDMTTSSPELATRIEFKMVEKKARSMDAPVSGGDRGARDATLAIMCGGERESFDQVFPLLQVVGKEIAWFGPAGSGQQAKMANQILIASSMVGTVEALLYGERANLDLEHLIEVLSKGAAGCWSLVNLAPRMLNEDWQPGFYIKHFIKDMKIALEDAEKMGLVLPGLELAAQFYDRAKIQGLEEKGTQALLQVLRSMNQK